MFGSDKRYLSIYIHEANIKVAQVKSSGVVEKVSRTTVADSSSTDDLARSLKSLLNGFDRKAPILCMIPAGAATSKTIEVPSSDPQEIRSIINLQASRHTPYSREEVLIGHVNLGSAGSNTKVLLVIVHRNVVKDRLDVLDKCGFTPERVLFVPEGVGRLYAKGLNLKKDSAPIGVIDFAAAHINFHIVGRGSVLFTRSIPFGIKSLGDGSDAKIVEEIQKSLDAYQSEEGSAAPGSFVVTTDNDKVKSFVATLQSSLNADVKISPYTNLVKANAVKAKLNKDFSDDSFLDVIAPVVTLSRSEINLMPEEIIMKRTVEHQSKEATKAGIAAVVIMVLLGGIVMSKIYFKDAFLNKNLREQFAGQKEEVKKLQDRMAKTKALREYVQGRMTNLDALEELNRITPNEIYLNSVIFDEDGTLTLAGVSVSMSQVFSYVKSLDDSPLFENAKTKSTSTKKDNGKDVAVFEVVMKVNDGHKE